jgi:hypothetical protein
MRHVRRGTTISCMDLQTITRVMPRGISDLQGNTLRLRDRFYFCACTSGNCDISCRSIIA